MAAQQKGNKELTGALFPEKNKKNEKGPDVTGTATVGGVEYRIAGWKREAASGSGAFFSLAFEHGDEKSTRDSKELTGVLFPEKEKKNENGPDVTGTCHIQGVEYRLAGWKKTSAAGNAYYSLSLELPRKGGQAAPAPAAAPIDEDF
ncbi:hypothetical protein [Thiomonas sp.]